jgi:hypothetical protein
MSFLAICKFSGITFFKIYVNLQNLRENFSTQIWRIRQIL